MASEIKETPAELQATAETTPAQQGTLAPPLLVLEEEKAPFLPPPAPVREDFIQNAVNFLKHPNVKGSPVKYRRTFLEKKGLTADEIDEAFRRVPDAATGDAAVDTTSSAAAVPVSNAVRTVRVPAQQQIQSMQQPVQQLPAQQYAMQPMGAAPAQLGSAQLYAPVQAQLAAPSPAQSGVRWTQMILALGVIGTGGAATALLAQKYAVPKLRQWLQSFGEGDGKKSPAEEAAAAAATAASAAASATKELIQAREEDKVRTEALVKALETQNMELRAALSILKDALPVITPDSASSDPKITVADLRKELRNFANVITEFTPAQTANSTGSQPPAYVQPMLAEIKKMLQTAAPSTNGPASAEPSRGPILAASPAAAAIPAIQAQTGPVVAGATATGSAAGLGAVPANGGTDQPRHPQSYMEVLEMVQKGEKPPGIRDINDKPADPTRPLSDPTLAPRPKPWERGSSAASQPLSASWHASPTGGVSSLGAGSLRSPSSPLDSPLTPSPTGGPADPTPWWQRRNPHLSGPRQGSSTAPQPPAPAQYNEWGAPVYEVAPPRVTPPPWQAPAATGVTIAEVESESGAGAGAYDGQVSSSHPSQGTAGGSSGASIEEPGSGAGASSADAPANGGTTWGRPGWVPPQIPQPLLPEAAAAMRARPPENHGYYSSPTDEGRVEFASPEEQHANGPDSAKGVPNGLDGESAGRVEEAAEDQGHEEHLDPAQEA